MNKKIEGHNIEQYKRHRQKLLTEVGEFNKKSIIKDINVFNLDYIPREIYYRERETEVILDSLKRVHKIRENLNIWGITGSGKTLTIKYCFSILEDVWDELNIKAKFIYIPCNIYDNPSKLLAHVLFQLQMDKKLGREPPKKGDKATYIEDIIACSKDLSSIVLCLDEVDILVRKDHEDVLFSLAGVDKLSFIFISNRVDWNIGLDARLSSRVGGIDVEFSRYEKHEIKGIVKQRLAMGLKNPNYIPDDIIDNIVEKSFYRHTDIRDTIRLLRTVVTKLDENNVDLNEDFIERCYFITKKRKIYSIIDSLTIPIRLMLFIIAELSLDKTNFDITSQKLTEKYNELILKQPKHKRKRYDTISHRTAQDYISHLRMYGLIEFETYNLGGRKGIKNLIKPKFHPELVHNYLNEG